jgi:hypothetical protein
MDRQEPVEELDWDAIEKQVELYDRGDRSPLSIQAKRLDMAFRDGYEQCEDDHEIIAKQMEMLLTFPAGNA